MQKIKEITEKFDSFDVEYVKCYSPACIICKDTINFDTGDIIYGSDWYHGVCWKLGCCKSET